MLTHCHSEVLVHSGYKRAFIAFATGGEFEWSFWIDLILRIDLEDRRVHYVYISLVI